MKGYDKLAVDYGLLLALPFREGVGTITRDLAMPHHQNVTLVGVPTWVQVPISNLTVLDFDGIGDYLDCPAANTGDLNFTTGDYSIACWIYKVHSATSDILVGRYGVDFDGWETYFYEPAPHEYLTLRHHHGSLAPDRTGCYSDNWSINTWWLVGITRSGAYPKHFRNGEEVEVTYDPGGLLDPDTCNRDLVIGTRFTKDSDWFTGKMWNLRIWDRELSEEDMRFIFEAERHLFGV